MYMPKLSETTKEYFNNIEKRVQAINLARKPETWVSYADFCKLVEDRKKAITGSQITIEDLIR